MGKRSEVLGQVEKYLAYMELAEVDTRRMKGSTREHRYDLSTFKRVEPMAELGLSEGADARVYYTHEGPQGQMDISVLLPKTQYAADFLPRKVAFQLCRTRSLTAAEARGHIDPFTPHAVEQRYAVVFEDGTYETDQFLWGWVGGRWMDVKRHGSRPVYAPGKEPNPHVVGFQHQHAIYRDMFWHVAFTYVGCKSSLLIPCDAEMALELFKNREKPVGKTRRDALMHWVDAHWRRTQTDAQTSVRIREYLRGKTVFTWQQSVQVQIMPAKDDLARLAPDATAAQRADVVPAPTGGVPEVAEANHGHRKAVGG